jgi:hypothetical protein
MGQRLGTPISGNLINCFGYKFSELSGTPATPVTSIDTATGAITISGMLSRSSQDLRVLAAAQSDQETGSSTTLAVTPGRQQFHPSAAKAWVSFTGATGAVVSSYNIASVSRGSAGVYTVNFTTAFSSASYVVVAGSNLVTTMSIASASAASINTFNGSFVATDAATVFATFYGDQ